ARGLAAGLLRRRRAGREPDPEAAALAERALEADLAPVGGDDLAHDGEAEARARRGIAGGVGAGEAVEDAGHLVLGDADARVRDDELHQLAGDADLDVDPPAFGRE